MTNANKVTLPREVAEAIESLRCERGMNNFGIVSGFCRRENSLMEVIDDYFSDFDVNSPQHPNALLEVLVNGYEVEKSPEEKVREYFEGINDLHDRHNHDIDRGILTGVEMTLDLLGLKIEGVNAE